ncbi:hypothetical protein [Magnetospirillum sp. XM-1]|uniref:hypothetical protein n=1 Tax=Magnetospirillum sp. XM-1 TaxID=1663591 RepID=UPI000839108F|nr:hypothetical protein [Magnetospirillum sp. XM-1]
MLDRARVLNWWIGRLTDAELAEYAGMTLRNAQIVLNVPVLKQEIIGGGRGSRATRRVPQRVRAAMASVQALHDAGMTLELAAKIVGTFGTLLDAINRTLDFDPYPALAVQLADLAPDDGFISVDLVPPHIARHCFVTDDQPDTGNALEPSRETGEYDPLGLLAPDSRGDEGLPWDVHLEIIDGRWAFFRRSVPPGTTILASALKGIAFDTKALKYEFRYLGAISEDRKEVFVCDDDDIVQRAEHHRDHFESRLVVNLSLAARRMKRRALGIPTPR